MENNEIRTDANRRQTECNEACFNCRGAKEETPEGDNDSRCPKQITAEMIPEGNSPEAMKERQRTILKFYTWWGYNHPSKKIFNSALQEDIFVSYRSKQETSRHAAKKYESSLAILHLDEILAGAVPILSSNADPNTKSQSRYERIIMMKYDCADIGTVKMTVGVYKKTHRKEQYCITVIEADIEDAFKISGKHKKSKTKSRPRKRKTKKPQKQKNEPA